MATRHKLLEKMRRNPRGDWKIEDFKAIAAHYQIEWRCPGGSHVVFVAASGDVLTVPARAKRLQTELELCSGFLIIAAFSRKTANTFAHAAQEGRSSLFMCSNLSR